MVRAVCVCVVYLDSQTDRHNYGQKISKRLTETINVCATTICSWDSNPDFSQQPGLGRKHDDLEFSKDRYGRKVF